MKITFSPNLSVATLRKATVLAESIENKQAELNALLTGASATGAKTSKSNRGVSKSGRKFSADHAAKISAGLKAKWAERKAAKAAATATPRASVPVPTATLTPASSATAA